MKKPDWLPNWRNGDEYPDPATTSAQQWAWEFLRRNHEYQADYKEIINFQEDDRPELNQRANEVISALYGPMQFNAATSPLPVAFLTRHLLLSLLDKKENYPWIRDACWRLVERYNLQFPLDPAQSYKAGFIVFDNLPIIETSELIMNPRIMADNRKLTISVDLDGNLYDQLNYIRGIIVAYGKQKKNRK